MIRKDYSRHFIWILVLTCTSFVGYCYLKYDNESLIFDIMCFCFVVFIIFICHFVCLNGYINNILNKLSTLINNIIDKNEEEVFSTLNDDLLSKLQSNTIKLINILKAENRREHDTKNEIQSLISDISHQLKNPFANLKMYFEFFKNEDLSECERNEFIDVLDIQIDKLNFLIESMIKMSRLETSIINLKPKKTDVEDVCMTAIRQVYEKAKKKDIEIKFETEEEFNLIIDEKWTSEAVLNILDNAVKYTSPGGTIKVSLYEYDLFGMIAIEDMGKGISKEEINDIFKRFYRGKDTEDIDGVGIGLYLADEIISKQNGFIKVKSLEGRGSTFSIMLPLNG